jgi:hypothetical protein
MDERVWWVTYKLIDDDWENGDYVGADEFVSDPFYVRVFLCFLVKVDDYLFDLSTLDLDELQPQRKEMRRRGGGVFWMV